jgi:hypothetical protein
MRDGATRAQEIEKKAKALVAWCREYVGNVLDNDGESLTSSGEWQEVLNDLKKALKPLEPIPEVPRGKWRVEWRMADWPFANWTRFHDLTEFEALRVAQRIVRDRMRHEGELQSTAIRVCDGDTVVYNQDDVKVNPFQIPVGEWESYEIRTAMKSLSWCEKMSPEASSPILRWYRAAKVELELRKNIEEEGP